MPSLIGNKPNQVPSNGDLGTLAFQDASNVLVGNLNATGVTTVQAGTVSAPALTTTGDTNTGIFFPAADTIAFAEGGVESMRITSDSRLGIGTSSPNTQLHIENATIAAITLTSTGSNNLILSCAATAASLGSPNGVSLFFSTSNVERMRIDNNGNVRVGTAALATTATNGFLYIPTCAGVPTGTPTAITGLAPMVIDSTNNKLYIYSGGAWVALN